MNIKKEIIPLDKEFPFMLMQSLMPAHYNMGRTHHWHECLEISYVLRGKGRYYIEDKIYEMSPGDIIVINNNEPHYLEVYNEEMFQPIIVFDPSLIYNDKSIPLDSEYLCPFFDRGTDFNNKLDPANPLTAEIRTNLLAIEQEYLQKNEGYRLMIKAKLLTILTCLLRSFRDRNKNADKTGNKKWHLVRLEEIINFISVNYNSDIRLEDMAAKMCVTPQYFSSFFKKVTGISYIEYLNSIRVKNAARLLKDTDFKVIDIANQCGFNKTANFNKIFKKHTGRVPSDYR